MLVLDSGASWPSTIPLFDGTSSYSAGDQVVGGNNGWQDGSGEVHASTCYQSFTYPPSYDTNDIYDPVDNPTGHWTDNSGGANGCRGGEIGPEGGCISCSLLKAFSSSFGNTGGPIGIVSPTGTGGSGNGGSGDAYCPLPGNFYLFYTDILIEYFSIESTSFGVSADGSNWQMSPSFTNSDPSYGWDNVVIDLEINSTDTGVTDMVTFPESGSEITSFTNFAADPASGLLTATFVFSRNGVTFGSIPSIPLYPVGTIDINTEGDGSVSGDNMDLTVVPTGCSFEGNTLSISLATTNGSVSNWFGGSIQFEVSISGSGALYDESDCTLVSGSITIANGGFIILRKPSVNTGTTLTITPQWVVDSTVVASFPSQTYNVTWS
jgi:hypothetical protein